MPRTALIVVAAGLLLSALSPLLYDDATYGGELDWIQSEPIPNSAPAPLEGGSIRIQSGEMTSTEPNFSGYHLYRIAATLALRRPRAAGATDATCTTETPVDALIARTPNRRAAYPRPSSGENVASQEVPREIVVDFAAEGGEQVGVRLTDAFGNYAIGAPSTVDWAPFEADHQTFLWRIGDAPPGALVKLRFASLWRTTGERKASISCEVGDAEVQTRTSDR